MPYFWGKHSRESGQATYHPLADHCLDVAVTFRAIACEGRTAAALRSCTSSGWGDTALDRLATLAYLHDVGKCNWGFQAKRDPDARVTAGHVIEGAALLYCYDLQHLLPAEWLDLLAEMVGWFEKGEEQLGAMLLASVSHHGRPVSFQDIEAANAESIVRFWRPHQGLAPIQELGRLARSARLAFPAAFERGAVPVSGTAALQQRFAGLVMLADWVGSDTQFFPYREHADEDRWTLAQAGAARALAAIGLRRPSFRKAKSFELTFGFPPRALQDELACARPANDDAKTLLVESETGSGKTEAALAWFLRLYGEGKVDGLYFALPTRVAARELYARVRTALEKAFPDPANRPGPALLAVPGYVHVDGVDHTLPHPDGALWDDDEAARWRERTWSSERPKRFLAAPIAVGTIDQALLATLQVKHSLLRSVCLDRHLLVVDEVHASDPYMRQVLKALLRGHRERDGHALLLSATLGEAGRAEYFNRPPLSIAAAETLPYPAITDEASTTDVTSSGRDKTVHFTLHDQLDEATLLGPLREALAAGARVLVVCNTVARSVTLLRAVEADERFDPRWLFRVNGVACPHHGRFARADREVLDAEVSRRLGKGSDCGPVLLIGTQTLEQSLDIDADWLVTDTCPMDVLLQRVGRLHRHQRARPDGFAEARVLLRAPPGADLTRYLDEKGAQFRGPLGIGRVYGDARVVQRTLDLLRDQPVVRIPADNRCLVEQATHPEAIDTLSDARWKRYAQEVLGRELQQRALALGVVIEDRPFGDLHYPGRDERVTTRLGEESLVVTLNHPLGHCFGAMVDSVAVPHHMLPRGDVRWPEQVEAVSMAGGFGFTLGAQRYRYTRFGLEKDNDA